jgi:hypothetical protein
MNRIDRKDSIEEQTMGRAKILKERTVSARGLEANLPRWMQMAKTVPAMRLDKVRCTRRAMETHRLESENVLDITIERLSEDLGLDDSAGDQQLL